MLESRPAEGLVRRDAPAIHLGLVDEEHGRPDVQAERDADARRVLARRQVVRPWWKRPAPGEGRAQAWRDLLPGSFQVHGLDGGHDLVNTLPW